MSTLRQEVLFDVDYKRKRNNFTLREDITQDFKDYMAKQLKTSMSRKLEILIEDFLIEVGVRNPRKKT